MSSNTGTSAPVRLSRREFEVAGLVAQGLTNREIAKKLFLSERTVDGHLEHIREKLGVNTRAQVAAWFVRQTADTPASAAPRPAVAPVPRPRVVAHPRLWIAASLVAALLAAFVGVLLLTAPPPLRVETVAGSECHAQVFPGGCFGDGGGLAIRAFLARPTSVAIDRDGVIYIADYGNGLVRMVKGGVITTIAGVHKGAPLADGLLATSVDLGHVSSVAIDKDGRPLLLTRVDGTLGVWKVSSDGFITSVVELPQVGRSGPAGPYMPEGGLVVAPDGALFIADRDGNQVWKAVDGKASPYAGTGHFDFSENGAAISSALAWPIGLALDKAGDLYIADAGNNRIRQVDPQGRMTTFAGCCELDGDSGDGGPATRAELRFPYGVAVGPDGSIVIADTGNHRLRRVVDGIIRPLAGTGAWGFNSDGPALDTMLNGPEGLAFDTSSDLFIADTENQRVREIPK